MKQITDLAGYNPGALRVLVSLLEDPEGAFALIAIERMGLSGADIWIAFKDYCGEDLEKFTRAVIENDPGLLEAVRREKEAGG